MKNKYLKTIMTLVLLLVCTFTFSITSEAKTTLKLNATSKNLKKGSSFTLKATSNVKNKKKIKWSTSDKKIVSISKTKGGSIKIKGKAYGDAVITCKVGKKVKRCKVKVDKYGMTKKQEKAFKIMKKYVDDYMNKYGYETIESYYINAWDEGHSVYDTYDELLANAPGFGCGYAYVAVPKDKINDKEYMKTWMNTKDFFERNSYNLYGFEWDEEDDMYYVCKLYYADK
jgi:hypothetical protein